MATHSSGLLAKSQVHTGAWQATDHEVTKESDSTKQLNHSKSRNPHYSLAGELPDSACTSCVTRNSLPQTPLSHQTTSSFLPVLH